MSEDVAIDVLIPTCNRACALAVTLTALSAQTFRRFRIVISDQSDGQGVLASAEIAAVMRFLTASDIEIEALRHLPRRGMAEQRAFLLARCDAPYCLFLDDDVIVEPDLLERLHRAIIEQQCGFVGSALHGLSYLFDRRPEQQQIDLWEKTVEPEQVTPGSVAWDRHHLHSAANLFHVQQQLALGAHQTRCYRVAWVGGCVMFNTGKLREAGGFDFWRELPADHCGEDVLAQLRVMARFGGCGIIPSGAYHMELPTTIDRRDVDAPMVLWQ
jgi:GT2 family glycosyltransferase